MEFNSFELSDNTEIKIEYLKESDFNDKVAYEAYKRLVDLFNPKVQEIKEKTEENKMFEWMQQFRYPTDQNKEKTETDVIKSNVTSLINK